MSQLDLSQQESIQGTNLDSFAERIKFAQQRVDSLDKLRIERALTTENYEFQHVFQLLSLLLHCNHPSLPAYVEQAPSGIFNFHTTQYQHNYLSNLEKKTECLGSNTSDIPDFDAVYAMGSTGSISQTTESDLDIWVCSERVFTSNQLIVLEEKFEKIKNWASRFNTEVNFYLMNPTEFKSHLYHKKTTKENSGSAQHFFLLDEFYRSAIRLGGKRLLWLHLLRESGYSYQESIQRAVIKGLDLSEWIDFGDFSELSIDEYFGASLWQLYKGINSPYKSAIKILLLESYTKTYPKTALISKKFKKKLLAGETFDYHFDPYLAMLEQVTEYLIHRGEFARLQGVRRCFYIKVTQGVRYDSWRLKKLSRIVHCWGWSPKEVENLNARENWKVKQAMDHQQRLINYFMTSYQNLVNFAKEMKVEPSILSQDSDMMLRHLYSSFEILPGKVPLLSGKVNWNLAEPDVTFIEVDKNNVTKKGWYLFNQSPKAKYDSTGRYTQYFPDLNQLVAWAYFNGIITANTQLHIVSKSVSLSALRHLITDLRLHLPLKASVPSSEAWYRGNEIRHLAVIINLNKDPTKQISADKKQVSLQELFNLKRTSAPIIGSVGLVYRNMWNEIRTAYFEDSNVLLHALKLMSNKLYQNTVAPYSVNVFCYSEKLNQPIQKMVTDLVNHCITIQTGSNYQNQSRVHSNISEQKWYMVFGDSSQAVSLSQNFAKKRLCPESVKLPEEIGEFAMEGFTQFFFEDKENDLFNVYVLDERNHFDAYFDCSGDKDEKVKLINLVYSKNRTFKDSFSFPQFYELVEKENKKQITIFQNKI